MARVMTLFPALGENGRRRAQRIRRLAESIGYGYREETDYTVRGGMRAQFCDDVVVYDLSGNDDTDGPYRALVSTYMHCDHVLLISWDYLPLNLLPRRPGGAPPYPYPLEHLPDGHKVRFPYERAAHRSPDAHDSLSQLSGSALRRRAPVGRPCRRRRYRR
jgi:hypothetical protein